jgi:hypothetical protein
MSKLEKAPTLRKLRNRNLTAIRYHGEDQVHHGWIVKRGRKLLHVHLVGIGIRKLDEDEQAHVTEL